MQLTISRFKRGVRDTQDSYLPFTQGEVSVLKITKDFGTTTLSHPLLSPHPLSTSTSEPLFCNLNCQGTSIEPEVWNLQLRVYLQLGKTFLVQETMNPLFLSFQMQLCWAGRQCHDLPKFMKSSYCSMVLMSIADNVYKDLFLAVIFFSLDCQSAK